MTNYIEVLEKEQEKKIEVEMHVGDTVAISQIIAEGDKQRVQKYEGTVTKMSNNHSKKTVTIRKIIDSIGVEKTFLIHSPLIKKIKVLKKGKVRRARLFYLRDRVGLKARRIKGSNRQIKDVSEEPKKEVTQEVKSEEKQEVAPVAKVEAPVAHPAVEAPKAENTPKKTETKA
ncbi:50S ribosomal protein L19 [bacterium]|nr:50S ribosomal protein L19 [bacterium]